MATSSTGNQVYICHFCANEFSNRATLFAHFSHCESTKSTTIKNEKVFQRSQLNQTQCDILHMARLHPITKPFRSGPLSQRKLTDPINLQIPLSTLYARGFLRPSNQSSFNDSDCHFNHSEPYTSTKTEDDGSDEDHLNGTVLNDQIPSYHIYKYSRRECRLFYARFKRAMIKKHSLSLPKKSRSKENLSSIFPPTNLLISIPTKIYSRQKLNSTSNSLYPLLFSPHFDSLVQLPTNKIFTNYLSSLRTSFHLIHSIASQEFHLIVHNYDHQQEFSYTTLSVLNLLRQTIFDYTINPQKSFKRTFFQSFHSDEPEHESSLNHDHELSIPPLKIRRHDDSSYEIEKRSLKTSSSSSSGMSITQISNGQHQHEDRRRFDTRLKTFSSRTSDNHINSNYNDMTKKDLPDITLGSSPLHNDSTSTDHQQSKDRMSIESLPHSVGQKPARSTSPILMREQANDLTPKYHSVVLNEGARIRIVNCSNDSNNKHSSSRSLSNSSTTKKLSNTVDKLDENWSMKSTRLTTRKTSSSNSKSQDIFEVLPSNQVQSVLLSNKTIASQWLTHNVFYRCHACSHEEFFVVLSRECMRLHISSKHGNMEENFKQRLSNFLNNQGRALKIFQHYLKWQQPWSEKEIDQIFQLANNNSRTNGAG